jgi:WD40 repeat protein
LAVFSLLALTRVTVAAPPGEPVLSLNGHTGGVFHVAYSPDSKTLSTSSKDFTARLWDADTGKELHILRGHKKDVYSSAFSPDGKHLASASADRTVKLWDTTTGKEEREFAGHGDDVYCVAFSPDGTKIASGCGDGGVIVWDVATGNKLHSLAGHGGRVLCVAFSPDGSRLATACPAHPPNASESGGAVLIWDVDSGRELFALRSLGIVTVAFSPNGKRLVGSSLKHGVKMWEVATGQECLALTGHTLEVYHVHFSRDGRRLASCSGKWSIDQAGELKIWDAVSGKELLTFKPHTTPLWASSFSPDGKRLATATGKFNKAGPGEAKVWDLSTMVRAMPAPIPDEKDMAALWDDLGGTDAPKAYRAVWALSTAPRVVPFLKERIRPPVDRAAVACIPKLIGELDSDDFAVRERAAKELEKLGQAAFPALRKALAEGSAEVQRQAGLLLDVRHLSAEEVRMMRAIEVLQLVGTAEVRPALEKLTGGAAEAPVTREAVSALRCLAKN